MNAASNSWLQESHANEDALCKAFVRNIEQRRGLGLCLPLVYFHITNEQPRQKGGNSTAAAIIGRRLKDMGRRSGVSDYEFLWRGPLGLEVGFLEAKMPGNYPTENQQAFFQDCKRLNIRTGVFRSVQEGLRILQDWGVLKEDTFA